MKNSFSPQRTAHLSPETSLSATLMDHPLVQILKRGWQTSPSWMSVALIVAGVSLALLPALLQGIPNGADLPNHFRFAVPFYEGISRGDLYPGWNAESNYWFGDPRFRFYPPGLYYLMAAARALTGEWYASSLLVFFSLAVLGSLGIYFCARSFCSERTALAAGLIYAFVPYHINEFYGASFLAEYAACAILPFAFAFVERTCRRGSASSVAGLALSYALLILTHVPLMVIGSLALLVYALLLMESGKRWSSLLRLSLGVALGLAASAFFWTKMFAELSWIKGNTIQPNPYYDYRYNFIFSPFSHVNLNVWYANSIAAATICMLLPAIALWWLRREGGLSRQLKAVALLAIISLLMATDLSRPLWSILPKLKEVQFPVRWLALVSIFGSIALAAALPVWLKQARRHPKLFALVAIAFLASAVYTVGDTMLDESFVSRAQLEQNIQAIPGSWSFDYWLPVWSKELRLVQRMNERVEAGQRRLTITSWEAEHRTFEIGDGPAMEARVRTFYYPHWKARAGGEQLATRPAEDGTLLISLPGHPAMVELEFREPLRVRAASFLSAGGWILIAMLFIVGLRAGRKSEVASGPSAQSERESSWKPRRAISPSD